MRDEEIRKLIRLLEENEHVGEIEMSVSAFGWKKWRVSRRSSGTPAAVFTSESPSAATPVPTGPNTQVPTAKTTSDLHTIKAPMVGTFFRAVNPESDPFVSEGSKITPGATLCIIEAMKLMNEIEADVAGSIQEILVENGQAVEYGQPLFLVEKL